MAWGFESLFLRHKFTRVFPSTDRNTFVFYSSLENQSDLYICTGSILVVV
jgi:hypothetical protein